MTDARLPWLLDGIVPPRDELPGAGGLGLGEAVIADAEGSARRADLDAILSSLPEGSVECSPGERDALLRQVESEHRVAFQSVVNMAYTAYYTDPRVLHALQQRTGYQAAPPQPHGYALDSFDEQLIERVRQRPAMWRRA